MHKKISEMTDADKAEFLEQTKLSTLVEHGVPWEVMEARIIQEIEDTFDDEKFVKMDPDSMIDAAYARKEFGDRKPALVDYLLWMLKFVTGSDYVDF